MQRQFRATVTLAHRYQLKGAKVQWRKKRRSSRREHQPLKKEEEERKKRWTWLGGRRRWCHYSIVCDGVDWLRNYSHRPPGCCCLTFCTYTIEEEKSEAYGGCPASCNVLRVPTRCASLIILIIALTRTSTASIENCMGI